MKHDRTAVVGKNAALLSIAEVGLGSILHGFRIPFSGHALSLNQGFIIARSTIKTQLRTIGGDISMVTALLKSLSPAGKKLTPMLAIAAQGQLFSLGVGIFGVNLVGVSVGMVLLSIWAFLQPILTYLLLYGETLIHVADYFSEKLGSIFSFSPEQLLWVLAAIVGVKCVLGCIVGWLAFKASDQSVAAYERRLTKAARKPRLSRNVQEHLSPWKKARLALGDLLNPLFLVSWLLTAGFFLFAKSDLSSMIWVLMRPLAIGFLIFFAVRMISFERLAMQMEKWRFPQLGLSLRAALAHFREWQR